MKKTLYYDAGQHGLIACRFIGWAKTPLHDVTGGYNAVITLKRTLGPWHRNETLHIPRGHVVQKSHQHNYRQYVKSAPLPSIDLNNLIPARF